MKYLILNCLVSMEVYSFIKSVHLSVTSPRKEFLICYLIHALPFKNSKAYQGDFQQAIWQLLTVRSEAHQFLLGRWLKLWLTLRVCLRLAPYGDSHKARAGGLPLRPFARSGRVAGLITEGEGVDTHTYTLGPRLSLGLTHAG